MSEFLERLEESYEQLEEFDDIILEAYVDEFDGTVEELAEDLELTIEETEELLEQLRKRVTSTGAVTRVKSRAQRSRRAGLTTGMSKTQRQLRARKAARTKKKNPGIARRALKKRKKALRRRKQMGIK